MNGNGLSSHHSDWTGIAVPVVLIVTGLTLLLGDHFGILSLDRIENLWPVAVIAFGLAELVHLRSGKEQSQD